jgi:hypothetical protein
LAAAAETLVGTVRPNRCSTPTSALASRLVGTWVPCPYPRFPGPILQEFADPIIFNHADRPAGPHCFRYLLFCARPMQTQAFARSPAIGFRSLRTETNVPLVQEFPIHREMVVS